MNQTTVSGKIDQIKGKIKQGLGEAIGNDRLANEGAADQVKGHAKEAWGDVKDAATEFHDDAMETSEERLDENRLRGEHAAHNVRDSITDAAAQAKQSVQRGIDSLRDDR
ncbi:MAG TPA: CsbD family protein [Granulicella sp.]